MTAPNFSYKRTHQVRSIKDQVAECEMFTVDVVFTVQQGAPLLDADIAGFLGATGSVMPSVWGGPVSTAYADDFRLQSWHWGQGQEKGESPDKGEDITSASDVIVATYTKVVVVEATRSTVTGSTYVETTKQQEIEKAIHLGYWRRGMEGYAEVTTHGISLTEFDPGAPRMGMWRLFTVNLPGTVTGAVTLTVGSVAGGTLTVNDVFNDTTLGVAGGYKITVKNSAKITMILYGGNKVFPGIGDAITNGTWTAVVTAITTTMAVTVTDDATVNAFTTAGPTTTPILLVGSVSEPTKIKEWQMGRFLNKTVWRVWIGMSVTVSGNTTFVEKPRQEVGWEAQIHGLVTPCTREWTCRHTTSVETDFVTAFPKNSAFPGSNPNGYTMQKYEIVLNTVSGEDEITAHYGTYVGHGSGLIGAGYLLPYSNVRQNLGYQATDGTPLGAEFAFTDTDGGVKCYLPNPDMRIEGWRLDFNISALSFPLSSVLTSIKDKVDSGSGATSGMQCLEAVCEPERGSLIRVRVDFGQLLGGTYDQYVLQGGVWVKTGVSGGTIALSAATTSFAGLYPYIL